MAERRAQLHALARELELALGAHRHAPVEPLAGPADHRHAALPAERRAPPLRRLAQQHLRAARPRRDRAAPTARSPCTTRCATSCPSCSRCRPARRSSRSVNTGLHSARTEIFTRMFPRCGIPDAYDGWRGLEDYVSFLYRTGSITEHTQIWWSVRPHLAYPTVEIRICDAQPDLARGAGARRALLRARGALRARATTRASRCPTCRTGCSRRTSGARSATGSRGELIDFERGEPVPARARIEQLLEWVAPGRRRDRRGAVPRGPRARTRPSARSRASQEGATLRGDLRRAGAGGRADRWLTSVDAARRVARGAAEQLARVRRSTQFLRRGASTLASLALREARAASDLAAGAEGDRRAGAPSVLARLDEAGSKRDLRAGADEPPGRLRRRRFRLSSGRTL